MSFKAGGEGKGRVELKSEKLDWDIDEEGTKKATVSPGGSSGSGPKVVGRHVRSRRALYRPVSHLTGEIDISMKVVRK